MEKDFTLRKEQKTKLIHLTTKVTSVLSFFIKIDKWEKDLKSEIRPFIEESFGVRITEIINAVPIPQQ